MVKLNFLSRLVVLLLTKAAVGKLSNHIPVVAACWNEFVRGRKVAEVNIEILFHILRKFLGYLL